MAKKAKSRVVIVRLLSQAMTGFFYSFSRPRTSKPMSMMKYDPIRISNSDVERVLTCAVRKHVLFLEQKRKGK